MKIRRNTNSKFFRSLPLTFIAIAALVAQPFVMVNMPDVFAASPLANDSATLDTSVDSYTRIVNTYGLDNIELTFKYDGTSLDHNDGTVQLNYSAGDESGVVNIVGQNDTQDSEKGNVKLQNLVADTALEITITADASDFSGSDKISLTNITVSGDVVSEPELNAENFNTVDGNYKGISVGFNAKNFGTVNEVTAVMTRDDGTEVTKSGAQGVFDLLSNETSPVSATVPFVIQEHTFTESADLDTNNNLYWQPVGDTVWDESTSPLSVVITVSDTDGKTDSVTVTPFNQGGESWPTYNSLLPQAPVDKQSPSAVDATFSRYSVEMDTTGGTGLVVGATLKDQSGVKAGKYTYVRFSRVVNGYDKEWTYRLHDTGENDRWETNPIDTREIVSKNNFALVNVKFSVGDTLDNHSSWKPQPYRTVGIDNSGPSFGLKSPVNGSHIRGTQEIVFNVTDHTGVSETNPGYAKLVNVSDDSKQQTRTLIKNAAGDWSATFDTSALEDGEYKVDIRPRDTFGTHRYNSNRGQLIVDNTAPVIVSRALNGNSPSVTPSDNGEAFNVSETDFVNGVLNLSTLISDGAGSGIKKVYNAKLLKLSESGYTVSSTYRQNFSMSSTDGITWTGSVDTKNPANTAVDGLYQLFFTAEDQAGNISNSRINVRVDNTAPVASIISHDDGDEITGLVTLVGKVDDVNPMNTFFAISGPNGYAKAETKKDGRVEHELEWDVSGLPNGEYSVRFETRDQAGNKTSVSTKKVKLNVSNPQPVVTGSNFNTHSGTNYKGLNVGFTIDNFSNVSSVKVELFGDNSGTPLVTNTQDDEGVLLNHINVLGNTVLSTPFITISGTYTETYWELGEYDWNSESPQPTRAVVTVTGTNNLGDEDSYAVELTTFTEPNNWTFASVLPAKPVVAGVSTEAKDNKSTTPPRFSTGRPVIPSNEHIQAASLATDTLFGVNLFAQTGNPADNERTEEDNATAAAPIAEENSHVLAAQDVAVADESDTEGCASFFGLCWYWWVGIVLALAVAGYMLLRPAREDGDLPPRRQP